LSHISGRNRQGSGSVLANEEDNQVPAGCGLPVGHIQIFAFHLPPFGQADVRLRKQGLLNFISRHAMLVGDLVDEPVLPDDFIIGARPIPFVTLLK